MTIDREQRDRLADLIGQFLNDEIKSFDFDDEIFKIAESSGDPTIERFVYWLWFLYDDCVDHHAALNKEEWDYCYRLLLLLRSDGQVKISKQRLWCWPIQMIAAVTLAALLIGAWLVGFNILALFVFALGGPVSMALASWRSRASRSAQTDDPRLLPFASFSQIRSIRERTPNFTKQSYRGELRERRLRTPWVGWVMLLPSRCVWMVCSPLVLAFQSMPKTVESSSVEMA